MTHPTYSPQHLQKKSIARLKLIYAQIFCTVEVTDRRCKDAWVNAIISHQSAQLEKANEQTFAQAIALAPEELTIVEISFYDHEYYAGDKLIATITHDHADFVTQRWVVMVNAAEVFRDATPMLCHRYICTHYKDGTLPVEEAGEQRSREQGENSPCMTENEIMAQIFNECEKYGYEILNDGIYSDDLKLGQVGCTVGNWWVIQNTGEQVACESVAEAVRLLSIAACCEQLLDIPFDELSTEEWQTLQKFESVAA